MTREEPHEKPGAEAGTENPLESIRVAMVTSARDQSLDKRDAWVWGIACGWGDALPDVAAKHRWSASNVARLRRLRARFEVLLAAAADVPLPVAAEVAGEVSDE